MFRRTNLLPLLGLLTFATVAPGCRKGNAPVVQFIADTDAVVGQTLTIPVVAIDPEGDTLDFRFEAAGVPDVKSTADLTRGPDGQGIFTFTPLASQIGSHFFDFYASDGKNEGRLTIQITVRGTVGSGSLPIFRKPLGSGTVLDLDQAETISLDIEIEDPDSADVTLTVVPPIIDNSNLSTSSSGLSGSWDWAPTREQIEAADRYDLTLSADDGDNPPTLKDFIIVIRKRSGADCPGEAPNVQHAADDFSTVQDLRVEARITDDMGLGSEPYLLYALDDPGDPVEFAKMTLVEMKLDSGDMRDGTWSGLIPNPVANEAEGTEADIYYLITAGDNDDADGDCDHLTDAPSSGTYNVSVTNQAGDGAGRCDPCSFDVQCGADGDLCIVHPDGNFCGASCDGDGDCSGTAICSPEPVDSTDGASARQCIPNSGSCSGGSGGTCDDDDFEPNDVPGGDATLSAGTTDGLTLCPGNEDWFEITVTESAKVSATLAGDNPPDMDLALTTAAGVLIKSSVGLDSDEELTSPSCLDPGTYMLRVYTFDSTPQGGYAVGYSLDTAACNGTGAGEGDCCEDNNSPGCEDLTVQTCVCDMDSFCCDTEWDDTCAASAEDDCGACETGTSGEMNEDCCTAQSTPGCTDATIQACVCADDAFCCDDTWDNFCVGRVGSLLCGPSCAPDDADGYCCEIDNDNGGCEINTIEECVCEFDILCCSSFWDETCIELITEQECSTAMCPA
ncbi:MAG: hypothetical protein JKY37_29205 [Nannocystaceae bacterium]|nr:hypothetical protein [Nannocystaceae bacterium]